MGFGREVRSKVADRSILRGVTAEDLVAYGLIPECVGRLQVVVVLDELTRDDLVRILTEPVNALVKQYQRLFEADGVELEFTQDFLYAVVDKAINRGAGARGLRGFWRRRL